MPGRQAHARRAPERFGRYELLDVIGKGGMAEVYRARATGPKGFARELAIKRILSHMSDDEEFVEMFVAEAKLSGALSHGNIVPIYEFGEVDGQLFLAMEYVDGTDLRTLLRRRRLEASRLSPVIAAHVAVEVLRGLAYAHARKSAGGELLRLVHRDVSPSNILVSRAGEVKLCDFGIAKAATRHTTSGRLKGKFSYMSPEQARGKPLDARSDLFSLGIVLWEMLSGTRLFQGDSDLSVLDQVREAQIPALPASNVPGEDKLREAVQRALEVDPAKRWPDAASFSAPLRAFLAQSQDIDPVRELEQIVAKIADEPAPSLPSVDMTPSGVVPVAGAEEERPVPAAAPVAPPAPAMAATMPDAALASADTLLHAQAPTQPNVTVPPVTQPRRSPVPGRRSLGIAVVIAAAVLAAIVAILASTGDEPPPRITATPLVRPAPPPPPVMPSVLEPPPVVPPAPDPAPAPELAPAAEPASSPAPAVAAPASGPADATAARVSGRPRGARTTDARPSPPPSPPPTPPAPDAPPGRSKVRTVDPFSLQR